MAGGAERMRSYASAHLSRHPCLGSQEWKPSGIPVAVVCDYGAVVSTSFPSPDAGGDPAAPATYAPDRMSSLLGLGIGALVGARREE